MKLKWPFIFAIFAMPLLIVFILHFWGENRFDVPVYHTEDVVSGSDCGELETPYVVNKSLRAVDSIKLIFIFQELPIEDEKLPVIRVSDRFNNSPVSLVCISPIEIGSKVGPVDAVEMSGEEFTQTMECRLLMEEGSSIVLIDGIGRIRGYYDIDKRDEIDRLEVEIEILLRNGEFKSGN